MKKYIILYLILFFFYNLNGQQIKLKNTINFAHNFSYSNNDTIIVYNNNRPIYEKIYKGEKINLLKIKDNFTIFSVDYKNGIRRYYIKIVDNDKDKIFNNYQLYNLIKEKINYIKYIKDENCNRI